MNKLPPYQFILNINTEVLGLQMDQQHSDIGTLNISVYLSNGSVKHGCF